MRRVQVSRSYRLAGSSGSLPQPSRLRPSDDWENEMGENPIGEWLQKALDDGKAVLYEQGKQQRIRYVAVDRTENYDDPEEWVRADFWAELIYRYGYPEERIAVEVPVPDRVPGDYCDLAVCRDDERTDPYAVIECKRDGVTAAEFEQAVEQAVGNGTWSKLRADYVAVVAGTTRRVLDVKNYPIGERSKNLIADLPKSYGAPEEFKFHKGGPIDIEPVTRDEMLTILRKCHDTLWGGGLRTPPEAFSDLCKIIFVKIADEKVPRKPGEHYAVQMKTGEDASGLHKRIEGLYKTHKKASPDIFTDDLNIEPLTLKLLVEHIQSTNFSATDVDVKGLAFERFMDSFFKGDFGQFFTPREVIRFAVDLLDPEPTDRVIDPAAGSGGFLLHALDVVVGKASAYGEPESIEYYNVWHNFATQNLFGIEINTGIARVCKMNMVLHGDGHAHIVNHDALDLEKQLVKKETGLAFGEFDLVLTNPPFGAQIKLEERPYLPSFDLGCTFTGKAKKRKPRKQQKSEIVFIERIWQLLRPGTGRAAIVLPDGILTNSRTGYVRNFVLERFQVLAVVSLPVAAFMHYGTSVKASVVFVRKLDSDEVSDPDAPVFLAEAASVGYDATGRQAVNQLPQILDEYRKFVKEPDSYLVELPTFTAVADEAEPAGDADDLEDEGE